MRLLERKNHGEISLTKDFIDDTPVYAILSHTWGDDDEEVTFKDLTEGSGKSKIGYQKIKFCAEQAARDGLRYFWVDTCCIDKSNNTELSEAINSMFRWYYEAARCYVYLADVLMYSIDRRDPDWAAILKQAIGKSRWFTRGWTLQELIAPASVSFFSKEGIRLGDKKSLQGLLHQTTGVPAKALLRDPRSHLGLFSVEDRISWAKDRATKRKEDKAYSLLGIFDVQMSLRYGEGEENAFKRLRRKIQKHADGKLNHRTVLKKSSIWANSQMRLLSISKVWGY